MTANLPTWDDLNRLVDEDPLKLRDLLWDVTQRLEQFQPACEASGNALYLDRDGNLTRWPYDDRGRVPADWRPLYVCEEGR